MGSAKNPRASQHPAGPGALRRQVSSSAEEADNASGGEGGGGSPTSRERGSWWLWRFAHASRSRSVPVRRTRGRAPLGSSLPSVPRRAAAAEPGVSIPLRPVPGPHREEQARWRAQAQPGQRPLGDPEARMTRRGPPRTPDRRPGPRKRRRGGRGPHARGFASCSSRANYK